LKITLDDVKNNEDVEQFILAAQHQIDVLGFTEHAHRHLNIVSQRAGEILRTLGYDEDRVRLAEIAAYLHDIGNAINRTDHAHTGAILANDILKDMGMPVNERAEIAMAIGNHDELTGTAVSDISAALILADKSDAHRSRVTKTNISLFDKHDRVNYAVTDAKLEINGETKKVTLRLTIDTNMCPVLDYFEIFMDRTMMSKHAANYLGLWFEVIINDNNLL